MNDFMELQAIQEEFVEYEVNDETFMIPAEYEDIIPGIGRVLERYTGKWFSRASAPGYLDCTIWLGPFDTEAEAMAEIQEYFYGTP